MVSTRKPLLSYCMSDKPKSGHWVLIRTDTKVRVSDRFYESAEEATQDIANVRTRLSEASGDVPIKAVQRLNG